MLKQTALSLPPPDPAAPNIKSGQTQAAAHRPKPRRLAHAGAVASPIRSSGGVGSPKPKGSAKPRVLRKRSFGVPWWWREFDGRWDWEWDGRNVCPRCRGKESKSSRTFAVKSAKSAFELSRPCRTSVSACSSALMTVLRSGQPPIRSDLAPKGSGPRLNEDLFVRERDGPVRNTWVSRSPSVRPQT